MNYDSHSGLGGEISIENTLGSSSRFNTESSLKTSISYNPRNGFSSSSHIDYTATNKNLGFYSSSSGEIGIHGSIFFNSLEAGIISNSGNTFSYRSSLGISSTSMNVPRANLSIKTNKILSAGSFIASMAGKILTGNPNFKVNASYSKWKWSLKATTDKPSYGALYKKYSDLDAVNERQVIRREDPFSDEYKSYVMPSKDYFNIAAQGIGGTMTVVEDFTYVMEDGYEDDSHGRINDYDGLVNNNSGFRFLNELGYNSITKNGVDFGDIYSSVSTERDAGNKIQHITTINGKIIGFRIHKTDGMVYEFTQPVYNHINYSKTKSNDNNQYENYPRHQVQP